MNTVEQSQQLIDKVCEHYQVQSKGLYNKKEKRPVRLTKMVVEDKNIKVDLSCLRMTLSYYLLLYTNIPQAIIGPLVGYADHTTISYSKRKVRDYFETEDKIFLSYWDKVNEIANTLNFKTDMVRIMDTHFIRMTPIQQ
jgi:chromosomal replication initiation ATPase DnaA